MPTAHDHLLKVSDLIDRPGVSRRVDLALAAPADFTLPLLDVLEPLSLVGVLESVVDGVLVRGRVSATLGLACARCLEPVETPVAADVVELYQDPAEVPTDAEDLDPGYEINEGHIDLDPLLRDALAPAVPAQPLCRPECAGLCASCGADLNEEPCDCADDDLDPRWLALQSLRLPPDHQQTGRDPAD